MMNDKKFEELCAKLKEKGLAAPLAEGEHKQRALIYELMNNTSANGKLKW